MYDWVQEQESNLQSQTGYEPGMLPLHYPAIYMSANDTHGAVPTSW